MRMTLALLLFSAVATGAVAVANATAPIDPATTRETLKPVTAFTTISDRKARSLALYGEMGRVLESPRCQNCHPATPMPTQGDNMHPHNPRIWTEADGHGVAGMKCGTCHARSNSAVWGDRVRSIPGDPKWAMAPAQMAWQGKSLGEICRQIKDPRRNGGKDLKALHDHMANDHLVGWGWNPGEGRTPAPGTQAEFGALTQAWIDSGAECPA